jgi:D-serine deaminase-like pyridoxal phosphate-dependent protein
MTTTADRRSDTLTFVPLPREIQTPAVVVDRARLEANIARLQSAMDERGVALRPHAKTHKSVRIARMQLDAGARGITVGTIGEAETFAAAGIADLFLAYPIWAEGPKAARLRAVHDAANLRVGVDSAEGAQRVAAAVAGSRTPLHALVEIDPGLHRSGVLPDEAVAVARAARELGLVIDGVFAHGGHSYDPARRARAAQDEVESLEAAASQLQSAGFDVETISAGSTPTMIAAAAGRVNEMRAGTYVLGDRQQWVLGAIPAEGIAAVVAATVVSVHPDRFVLDSGAKSLTKDKADWLVGYGEIVGYLDSVIERLSDYHAVVRTPEGAGRPKLGDVVAIAPNHICPVIDLFDSFHVIADDGTTERWPVDARGRSG